MPLGTPRKGVTLRWGAGQKNAIQREKREKRAGSEDGAIQNDVHRAFLRFEISHFCATAPHRNAYYRCYHPGAVNRSCARRASSTRLGPRAGRLTVERPRGHATSPLMRSCIAMYYATLSHPWLGPRAVIRRDGASGAAGALIVCRRGLVVRIDEVFGRCLQPR